MFRQVYGREQRYGALLSHFLRLVWADFSITFLMTSRSTEHRYLVNSFVVLEGAITLTNILAAMRS